MVAATASTLQQFTSDALLVVLILLNAGLGWRTRTLRRVVSFAGLYAGVVSAFYIGNGLASVFRKQDVFANAWAFIAVTAAVIVVFEVLGRLFADRLERIAALTFDRVVGFLVGGAVGFFQASVLFMVAIAVGSAPSTPSNSVPPSRDAAANAVRSAPLSNRALRAQPALHTIFSPVFSSDLSVHLADGTTTPAS